MYIISLNFLLSMYAKSFQSTFKTSVRPYRVNVDITQTLTIFVKDQLAANAQLFTPVPQRVDSVDDQVPRTDYGGKPTVFNRV